MRAPLPIADRALPRPMTKPIRWRWISLLAVHALILIHVVHYWWTGSTLSPLEPSETMYALELGHINAGTLLFLTAIAATALYGRFFCGWGCHLIALQDGCAALLRRMGVHPKPLRSRALAYTPLFLALYMFLWPTLTRLWSGKPSPAWSLDLTTNEFWSTFPGPVVALTTLAFCGGLIVYLLGNKGFCRFACPYGAVFSIADTFAPKRIRVTDACVQCGVCTATCSSNIQISCEIKEYGEVVDSGCMKCMDCVSACPENALYYGPRSVLAESSSVNEQGGLRTTSPRAVQSDYSFVEELVSAGVAVTVTLSTRGLYGFAPLLLAVALGVTTAHLVVLAGRLFRRRDLRLAPFRLVQNGRIRLPGWLFLTAITLWIFFVVHGGLVQYHHYRAGVHLASIRATLTELVPHPNPKSALQPGDRQRAHAAYRGYLQCDQLALLPIADVKLGLFWSSLATSDFGNADRHLSAAVSLHPKSAFLRELEKEWHAARKQKQPATNTAPWESQFMPQ